MGEAIKTITLKLNLNRMHGLLVLLGIVIIVAGFQFNKIGVYSKIYAFVLKSEATFVITDTEKNEGLSANISLTNLKRPAHSTSGTADLNGSLVLKNVVSGSYRMEVSYSGYNNYSADIKIKKWKNGTFSYKLEKTPPEESVVSGVIKDYISESLLSNVTVTIGELSATSDSEGKFEISKVITGTKDVIIKQKGYLDYSNKVEVVGKQFNLETILLVPVGKVVYVSNKDLGKRGIYTANYDGSGAKALVDRVSDKEDFSPLLSPDYKKVAFLSTREGQKDGSLELNSLYIVDIDGKNLTKIGDSAEYTVIWSANSKYIVWGNSYKEGENRKTNASIYNVASKSSSQVISDSKSTTPMINPGSTKLYYALNNAGKYELSAYDISAKTTSKLYENSNNIYIIKVVSDTELIYGLSQNGPTKYYSLNLSDNSSKETEYQYPKRYTVKSPDGKLFAYVELRDGKSNLFIASDSNGKGEKQLSTINTAVETPYWSADSKLIIFNSQKTGESALYIINVDGGVAKKVIDVASNGYGYGM